MLLFPGGFFCIVFFVILLVLVTTASDSKPYVCLVFFFHRVVEFASYSDLKNAIEKLSGKEINGRKIKLIEGSKRHRYGFLLP